MQLCVRGKCVQIEANANEPNACAANKLQANQQLPRVTK